MSNTFYAGAARTEITPVVGTLLYGYHPKHVSTGVRDPLTVTAAAFRQGDVTAVLLTVTVCSFQTALSDEIRGKLSEIYGIPAGRFILAATHTHSGPNLTGMEGWGGINREYADNILIPGIIKAVGEALESMEPAEIATGEIRSEIGINRREQLRNGLIDLGQNPWGAFDPTMTCIAIRATEYKRGILNLIHYGCHGTAAGCNREISRDWSGIMTDRLEAETGTLTAFWNGAEGDVGPRLSNGLTTGCGDVRYAEEHGAYAAMDAIRAFRSIGGYVPGSLKLFEGEVKIPYKPLADREFVKEKLASYADPDSLVNFRKLEYAHYKAIEEVYEAGVPEHDTHYRYPQTILCLGDAAFIPFPFEIFSEIALRIRKHAPVRYALSLSNTNGYNAYLPTEDQIVRGGYEIQCFLYSGAYTLVNHADQVLIDENLKLMGVDYSKEITLSY